MVTAVVKLKDNSWKENYDKPRQNIKKQRYHLLTKVCIVKTMLLSGTHVHMWELDHNEGLNANELRLLICGIGEESWESLGWQRSNQSILKEISPDYSLEGLILNFQYFDHLMQKVNSVERTLMQGKIEGKRRRGWQRMSLLDSILDSMDKNLSRLQETVKDKEAWHAAIHGVAKSWTRLSDWTTTVAALWCMLKFLRDEKT